MNTLMLQQQGLLDALFARPGSTLATGSVHRLHTQLESPATRGLMAYQSNGHALAERCLLATYPVIAQLIGSGSFNALARDLWHHHPPRCGDLAQWGDALPAFLTTSEQLADVPYLADVARVEWALHRAADAPDADADMPSFARLSAEDPEGLTLWLAPGTALITSAWPVVSLVTTHTIGDPALAETGQRVRDRVGETAVVWRPGWRPCVAVCPDNALDLLRALQRGAALTEALGQVPTDFDFSNWLAQAVHSGLVLGVANATPQPPHTPHTKECP